MLGGNGGLRLWIELHNSPEFYTNGDHLYGTLFVDSSKPLSLRNIEIKLRCEEQAYVWVNNSQGGYYDVETQRHLSLKVTVFPTRDVQFQNPDAIYTLQSGIHNFDFQYQIPISNTYPGSYQVRGSQSNIRWYVKGVVHRGNKLSGSKRTLLPINVVRTPDPPQQLNEMCTETSTAAMTVFLPSYSEISKTAAGRLKGLLPSSQYKKRTNVNMSASFPLGGLLQYPVPICLNVDISSDDDELLLLKGMSLYLKQKTKVSVSDGWHTSLHRELLHIWSSADLNLSLKKGLKAVHDQLENVCINDRPYETFTNRHFQTSYKLVVEAVVSCRAKPSSTTRLRISSPVFLHNFLAGRRASALRVEHEPFEELPTYCAEPRVDEETVTILETKS